MGATVRYNNLTGGLNTVQGINTINQSTKRTESPDMQNVEYYKLGGLCTMQGNTLFGTPFTSTVTLGYEYIYSNNKYMIVCTNDGNVWRYDSVSNSFVSIYKFPTPTQRHSICSFNNGIVITNGVDDLVFYQYNRNEQLTGTVTVENNSTEVVGDGTKFTLDVFPGDYITINNIDGRFRVDKVTDDTHLTLSTAVSYQATQSIYAWTSEDNTTYYTFTTDNGTNITVYSLQVDMTLNTVTTNGTISGNVLSITETTTTTATGTRYDSWTQPIPTSNTSWGTISGNLLSNLPSGTTGSSVTVPYQLYSGNTAVIMGGFREQTYTYYSQWDFPKKMNITSYRYNVVQGIYGSMVVRLYNSEGTLLTSRNIPRITNETTFVETFDTITDSIRLEISITITSAASLQMFSVGKCNISGKQSEEYQYETTTTVTVPYTRDTEDDQEISTTLTGLNYYLTDISELNAVYTTRTQEGEIDSQFNVRGLALNSYQGRIFVGANDGTLYYSEVGLIHGWELQYGAGAIPTFYDDNSDFTALGLFDKYLVICKRERTYVLDGTDVDDGNWILQPYSDYTCDSQQSWLVCNNMFLTYSRNPGGIYPILQRTIYNPNYQGIELSTKIRDDFIRINESRFDYIFPVFNPKKKYIMFYVPMISGNGSNTCYIYDLQTKTWLKRVVSQNVTCAFRFDNNIYIGTQDGLVLKEFSGTTFNSTPIEWSWCSPWFSFGDGSNYLSTREFRINLAEEGANRFQVRVRRDGIEQFKTRNINQDSSNYVGLEWESGLNENSLTDTLWDEDVWTATKHTIKRFPLPNQYFQTIQVEFCGTSEQEGMNIYGFEFHGIQLEEVPY